MIKSSRYCDFCGDQDTSDPLSKNWHWTQSFGAVYLNFESIPVIQQDYSVKDCCPSCALIIEKVVKDKINEIKGILK